MIPAPTSPMVSWTISATGQCRRGPTKRRRKNPRLKRRSPTAAPWVERVTLGAILGLLVLYVSRPIWDIDLFWHIAAGRFFLENGGIPTTDIFSPIDPDLTWVTFQWLYQVLVYLLEQAGGWTWFEGFTAA